MLADHYDELITGFGGPSPLTPHQALQRLYREAQGGLLDRTILSNLTKLVGIYPVHSPVRLNTQEQAVVTELNPSMLHQPVVTITHNPSGDEMPPPSGHRLVGTRQMPHLNGPLQPCWIRLSRPAPLTPPGRLARDKPCRRVLPMARSSLPLVPVNKCGRLTRSEAPRWD